jgi:hypothetical protein
VWRAAPQGSREPLAAMMRTSAFWRRVPHQYRQAHLAHLIEEQDLSRCQLDVSRLRPLSAGGRTAFVPKQLGLERFVPAVRAVDGDERALFPR